MSFNLEMLFDIFIVIFVPLYAKDHNESATNIVFPKGCSCVQRCAMCMITWEMQN